MRRTVALAAAALLGGVAGLVQAQQPAPPPGRQRVVRLDSLGRPIGADSALRDSAAQDTGRGRRILPSRPSRSFQTPDSVVQTLLNRRGFRITRYTADSVTLFAEEKEIRLAGRALIEREGTTLEADSVRYVENTCDLFAVGGPRLFDPTGVVVGEGMRYDACDRAGIIENATTDFQEGSAMWHLRGDFAVDNLLDRTYAAHATITSCDLVEPHYHFAARQVKYVSKRLMVSRPAVLYVADVPVLWLPFIFQDMRRGRRSGLIPPQFGINDIVRNTRTYQRHIANLGYYWAMSDYADAQATFGWFAGRYITLDGRLRYRWLNRFLSGGLMYRQLRETGGSTSSEIRWEHLQQFSLQSSLNAGIHYVTSSRVVSRNSVDPVLAVANIDSRVSFQHKYAFGTLSLGGSRSQSLDKPQVSTTFPTVSFTPNPIAVRPDIVWSPGFSLTNSLQSNVGPGQPVFRGAILADSQLANSRNTSISIASPLRIGRWNWPNSITITDASTDRREVRTIPDPADTTQRITRTYAGSFETTIDWNTSVSLPVLFQGTWNLAPSVGIVNTTGGAFLLRNRFSGGEFVSQGKRLNYAVGISPTLFGRFGGVGPVAAIRHSVSPSLSWSYSPSATVPEAYARAVAGGGTINRRSDARQTISIGLSQNFEAKLRPPPRPEGDTTSRGGAPEEGRKIRLLSIQSSSFSFDIEQAKKRGRTGWTTDPFSNTFSSDLLRGFSLSMSHDLWLGPVGFVGSRLRPTLTSVTMGFSLGAGSVRTIGTLLGLRPGAPRTPEPEDSALADTTTRTGSAFLNAYQRGPGATRFSAPDRLGTSYGTRFSAGLNYSFTRPRPDPQADGTTPPRIESQMLSGSMNFQPTPHWNVSWNTGYDFVTGEFTEHTLRLDRDLHDWRATFTFVKSPNGNFLFSFIIMLIDQPEIKFDYDQRNIR